MKALKIVAFLTCPIWFLPAVLIFLVRSLWEVFTEFWDALIRERV
jgi:hypothetical protein